MTPLQMALYENITSEWLWFNYTIDFMFFIDIIIIFNSQTIDEDFEIISDRPTIVCTYLRSWFLIDLVAILPFDAIFETGAADLVRYTKIGRITRMLKLMKLIRLMKLQKTKSFSILAYVQDFL